MFSAICAILICMSTGQPTTPNTADVKGLVYDILIRGGTVIDGTGGQGYAADVLVHDGMIVRVGKLKEVVNARQVIDARGKVVTPGFIDAHAHGDPLKTPDFKNFLAMGVTTICLGQDGDSPPDLKSWMNQVDTIGTGPNIAVFVGHGTVRDEAGVGLKVGPTDDELARMAALVDDGMRHGALGLTTGLEYQPGSFSDLKELVALAKPVAKHGGLVMSHMRSEDDDAIEGALDELISQGSLSGAHVHVSHIKVTYGHGAKRAQRILERMQAEREKGVEITADIYPYTASYTGIGIVFPDWAKPPHDYADVVKNRRVDLADYLRRRITLRNGPRATLFGTAPYAGKTLEQVAAEMGKPFEDVLIDDIGPSGAGAAYFVMDQELQSRLMADQHVVICSDGRPGMRHPRGYGSFVRVIRKFALQDKLFSVEQAIHKMTGLTADTVGLTKLRRGRIDNAYHADLLVFDPQAVRDNATFEEPHKLATGIDWVIVNGLIVKKGESFPLLKAGKMLRRESSGR